MKKLPPFLDRISDQASFAIALVLIVLGIILDKRMEESAVGLVILSVGGLFLILTMYKRRQAKK